MMDANQKIAILSYGSLVHRPIHSVTGAQLEACDFEKTDIAFPVGLSVLNNTNRITAVIDNKEGVLKNIWVATSLCPSFYDAMQNLAAREGAAYDPGLEEYDTRYIFYIKKKDTLWIIKNDTVARQKISDEIINQLIEWASQHEFTGILWTSCPIITLSSQQLVERLLQDDILLHNAQEYIAIMPDGPQTPLEKAIINGKDSLMKFLQGYKK